MNYRKQMKYKQSEIEFREAIKMLSSFNPIKIVYNRKKLYNDYDSKKVIEVFDDGSKAYGEKYPPEIVLEKDYSHLLNKKVYSIKIDIVEHHHSIIYIKGEK